MLIYVYVLGIEKVFYSILQELLFRHFYVGFFIVLVDLVVIDL